MSYRSVYCINASHVHAHRVIQRLCEIEFPAAETSLLFLNLETERADPDKGGRQTAKTARVGRSPSPGYGELGGKGALQTMTVPGVGPLIAFGPVAAILNDAVIYGIAGGLREFGVPESEASHYEARLKEGDVFVAIRSENPDKSDRVRDIFAAEGASEIRTLMHVLTPKISRRSLYGTARLPAG
jgi:hypothetical protein